MHTCGLCPARALTWWWHDEWDVESWLCGHHANERAQVRLDTGWQLVEDERETLTVTA